MGSLLIFVQPPWEVKGSFGSGLEVLGCPLAVQLKHRLRWESLLQKLISASPLATFKLLILGKWHCSLELFACSSPGTWSALPCRTGWPWGHFPQGTVLIFRGSLGWCHWIPHGAQGCPSLVAHPEQWCEQCRHGGSVLVGSHFPWLPAPD